MVDEDTHPPQAGSAGSWREARTQAILRAALEELAQVGYSAFSMESVAGRVGIAKTTVYRRYPTKAELVRSAIRQYLGDAFERLPNTGSFRGDLIALGVQTMQLASSVLGQGLFRTQLLDRVAPELEQIGKEFEAERDAQHKNIADRAIARGELAKDVDFARLLQVLSGAILFKVVLRRQSVDELEISRIVDLLLSGVAKPSTRPRHSP